MSRLIIISNRLPFSVERQNGEIIVRQSSGGLVSAIKSYIEKNKDHHNYTDKVWVGSMDSNEPDWKEALENGLLPDDFSMKAIFPDNLTYKNFYNGFSNSALWPLFHYFPSLVEFRKDYLDDYRKMHGFVIKVIDKYYEALENAIINDSFLKKNIE